MHTEITEYALYLVHREKKVRGMGNDFVHKRVQGRDVIGGKEAKSVEDLEVSGTGASIMFL